MELVDGGGRRIACRRAGAGPPLVLLHGGWSDGRAWGPQLLAAPAAFDTEIRRLLGAVPD